MYALKTIGKNPEGNLVEHVHVLGKRYTLQFVEPAASASESSAEVARVTYGDGGDIPAFVIRANQDAYITTLEGTTVRVIRNRGKY